MSSKPIKCHYRRLGNSGLYISVPIFACMGLGDPNNLPWLLGEHIALPLPKAAYDRSLNTWDTANVYSNGESEVLIGKALERYSILRENVVIMTKCFWESPHWLDPSIFEQKPHHQNQFGLWHTAILNQVYASLRRLNTPYIDFLQIHRFDSTTPLEETISTLHELIQSGKVRHIGASSHYNLLYRGEEREMNAFANETGVGLIPWAPLCRGHLARPPEAFKIMALASGSLGLDEADLAIVKRVMEISDEKGWPMGHVALAWILRRVASSIIGFSSVQRMDEAIAAVGKMLSAEEEEEEEPLEALYRPKAYLLAESL
ncbi:NADP-dependent oxidoreductase domain-containing protein [Aspergillus keveii]|uniref:NADP-dependent oxidoreductase domain-containing protein n=1 Tax=Aspergillus keveii TaxID=714993 RepID=A0ABR4FLW5_9EURO